MPSIQILQIYLRLLLELVKFCLVPVAGFLICPQLLGDHFNKFDLFINDDPTDQQRDKQQVGLEHDYSCSSGMDRICEVYQHYDG